MSRRPSPRPASTRPLAGVAAAGVALTLLASLTGAAATASVADPPVAARGEEQAPASELVPRVVVVEEEGDSLAVRTVDVGSVEQAEALASELVSEGDVVTADVDSVVRASGDPLRSQQWGLTSLRAETAWARHDATGQVVAVVDSGVRRSHPDLTGVVLPGLDLVDTWRDGGYDPDGHGTHVAGVVAAVANNDVGVAGLARGAKVLPVRVLDADGYGYASDTAAGIIWAVDHGADVINLSLGGPDRDSATAAAVQYASEQDVVVVAAVGNEYAFGNPVSYPAALPDVVGVGAVDSRLRWAPFSNQGNHVDLVAPGVGIVSTTGTGYATWDGTSMATPYVAAAVALLRAKEPGLKDWQVAGRLHGTARDLGAAGRDQAYGYGLVDPVAAFDLGEPQLAPMALAGPTTPLAHGSTATFTASWTGGRRPAKGTVVTVQEQTGSTWTARARATVGSTGPVTIEVPAVRPGRFRAVTASQVSPVRTVVVKASFSALATSRSGSTFTVTGKAHPHHPKVVVLQRWNGKQYSEVARASVKTGFRVSHTMTHRTNRYRVKVLATATTTAAYSMPWTVRR